MKKIVLEREGILIVIDPNVIKEFSQYKNFVHITLEKPEDESYLQEYDSITINSQWKGLQELQDVMENRRADEV